VSSTSSEKYERDVTILNHCFDDIEKFIARLQHAAAASRELERRRRLVVLTGGLFLCMSANSDSIVCDFICVFFFIVFVNHYSSFVLNEVNISESSVFSSYQVLSVLSFL
jgi:hypothetical protein